MAPLILSWPPFIVVRTDLDRMQDFERTVNGQATDIHNENPADELNYRKESPHPPSSSCSPFSA